MLTDRGLSAYKGDHRTKGGSRREKYRRVPSCLSKAWTAYLENRFLMLLTSSRA